MIYPLILTTPRDRIRKVPEDWRERYSTPSWQNDQRKQEISRKLAALDTETCSAEDINAIIGNSAWTTQRCDLCGSYESGATVHLGEPQDYDASCVDVCLPCLVKAGDFAREAQGK